MAKRFETPTAVMPLILSTVNGQLCILLQERQNTGYADGMWDCAGSGHVEKGESLTEAVAREMQEETGLAAHPEDIRFGTMNYKYDPSTKLTYVDAYFVVECFIGEPRINEPEKIAKMAWYALDALPLALIPDRKVAIENYLAGVPYAELGWEHIKMTPAR